jgi:hypothetical protein
VVQVGVEPVVIPVEVVRERLDGPQEPLARPCLAGGLEQSPLADGVGDPSRKLRISSGLAYSASPER